MHLEQGQKYRHEKKDKEKSQKNCWHTILSVISWLQFTRHNKVGKVVQESTGHFGLRVYHLGLVLLYFKL